MKKFLLLLMLVISVSFMTCDGNEGDTGGGTYIINFDANAGEGGQTTPVTATYGQPMPPLTASVPTRDDYFFTGYFDAETDGTKYYNADLTSARDWDKKENTKLFAQWSLYIAGLPDENSIVALVRAPSSITNASQFDEASIKALVTEAVDLAGGLTGIVKAGDTVVLKPNLITTIYGWSENNAPENRIPETVNGVCTDYRVVKAVSELVREIIGPTGKILVMEGSGKGSTQVHFDNAGYTPENLPEVDEIIPLDDEGTWDDSENSSFVTEVQLNDYRYKMDSINEKYRNNGVYYVNKKMYDADALICLPVVKNHWDAVVTGAIKNISIGAAPPRVYGISEYDVGRNNMVDHGTIYFHQWIADYYSCLPADFVIMDGLQGCEKGPLPGGTLSNLQAAQKNLRVILASKDALAIDTVETNIINWDFETVKYLEYLTERGNVGVAPKPVKTVRGNPKNITVRGNIKVDDIRTDFEGNFPMSGGNKLTAAQKAQPSVSIASSSVFTGQNLMLNLNLSPDTVKVEVDIDGSFTGSFSENLNNLFFDTSAIDGGSHQITVRAYTKYMRSNTTSATIVKQ